MKNSIAPTSSRIGVNVAVPRLDVEFDQEATAVLEQSARRHNTTETDIIRRAINLDKWFLETVDSGARVLVERDGAQCEIVKLR